mmetsp:Transcript_21596/g.38318  ORF Transcript_21596/g.38318 Transcript_21596/m.38318 type:complete len:300 (+) Transcript_21596:48-947(+)
MSLLSFILLAAASSTTAHSTFPKAHTTEELAAFVAAHPLVAVGFFETSNGEARNAFVEAASEAGVSGISYVELGEVAAGKDAGIFFSPALKLIREGDYSSSVEFDFFSDAGFSKDSIRKFLEEEAGSSTPSEPKSSSSESKSSSSEPSSVNISEPKTTTENSETDGWSIPSNFFGHFCMKDSSGTTIGWVDAASHGKFLLKKNDEPVVSKQLATIEPKGDFQYKMAFDGGCVWCSMNQDRVLCQDGHISKMISCSSVYAPKMSSEFYLEHGCSGEIDGYKKKQTPSAATVGASSPTNEL